METFQFERTSFQIEPFDSGKLSIRVTNAHKAINTELFLWLERDSTYSVYVPEAQNTHQAAMAIPRSCEPMPTISCLTKSVEPAVT
jgi:hypothetical protein